ncbi:MAG: pyridoxal phosphate-dependent aminotransferase [Bacteroidia bacterium]|nr:pyridoxal phosphate-dependent aminotransferase [Bacteroidia bacterium]
MAFSTLISSLAESATLGISKKVRELKASGMDVIGLTLGEPDFDTPVHIRDAAKKALDDGFTHYPPVAGYPELKEAIVAKLKRDNGLDYKPNQIVVSTGAKQSLYNVVMALMNPGDRAILQAPYWVSYEAMLHMVQAEVHVVETTIEQDYKMTPAQLEAAITPNTKLIFLNSPNNPTGTVYTRAEITALVEVMAKYPQLYIISDEIYEYMIFDEEHVSLGTYESIRDRVITVNGFSKGFAMTGWRLGYIAAPKEIADMCDKVQGQVTSGCTAFAQIGAVAALTGSLDSVEEMRDEFRKRRDALYLQLKAIPGLEVNLPAGAFYFYPDLKAFLGKTSPEGEVMTDIDVLSLYILDKEGLAVVPGSAFGTATHVRLSYAYSVETLNDAVGRLGRALATLS